MNIGVMCAFGCEPTIRTLLEPFGRQVCYEFECGHGRERRSLSDVQMQRSKRRGGLPAAFLRPIHELKYIQTTREPRSLLLFNRKRKDPRKLGFVP